MKPNTPITDALEKKQSAHICGSSNAPADLLGAACDEKADLCRELERENARLREDLSAVVCAILKRNGADVTNMTAMGRLEELHANESIFCRTNKATYPAPSKD